MPDNRPPVYYDTIDGKRVLVIRASAIGNSCMWELVAAGQGIEGSGIPAKLQVAFNEGNDLEPVILGMMERDGFVHMTHQDEGELWLSDDVVIRFHPDGLSLDPNDSVMHVTEAKALSDALWQTARRGSVGDTIDEYNWQLSVMMHYYELPAVWVAYNKGGPHDEETFEREYTPDQGKILYEFVYTPPIGLDEIKQKAFAIKSLVEGEDITTSDLVCGAPGKWPCYFLNVRPEPEVSDTYEVPDDQQEEVDNLIRQYLYFKGQEDEAAEQRKVYGERIAALHDSAKKVITDQWEVPIVRGTSTSIAVDEMTFEDKALWDRLRGQYKRVKDKKPYLTRIKRR